jgi:CubicO group peptidase (beta-lactamase class C family)
MHPARTLLVLATVVATSPVAAQPAPYLPGRGDAWERRSPARVGMDAALLDSAVAFAVASESPAPRDLEIAHHQTFGREPFGEPVGPFAERGAPTGIVLRHGYIVAEWGDPHRVDMTFSVTKSFLSTVVGVALDRGLIRSVDDPVNGYVGPVFTLPSPSRRDGDGLGAGRPLPLFDDARERRITWDHLLRQTSDWEGTLWGKPDWADRPLPDPRQWRTRERAEPGATYEYNDVRVNLLALAALGVWRRPLPQVLRDEVMDPIGASPTWRWTGYDNSWVVLDGAAVQSVSGGGHWGGGMFISARDMARFGLLALRRGRWGDRQVLSERWVEMALTPTPAQPDYGFMNWFLNRDLTRIPGAPATAFVHLGNGTNAIYVDPENDLVIVVRWIASPALDGLVQRVIASIRC